jgi:tetratricopeptide (TPR) repeat protein
MDKAALRELVDLMAPHCDTVEARRALFAMALGLNHHLLKELNFESRTDIFIVNCALSLLNADAEPGKTALWAVLETIYERVGNESRNRILALAPFANSRPAFKLPDPVPQSLRPPLALEPNELQEVKILLKALKAVEQKGAWDVLIDLGERICRIDPYNKTARKKMANAFCRRGMMRDYIVEHRLALDDYSKAIELDPLQPKYYFERGKALNEIGDGERALADLNKAIQLDPNVAEYYAARCNSYRLIGDTDRLVMEYTRAIFINPNIASFYLHRGYAYLKRRNLAEAYADFQRASQMGEQLATLQLKLLERKISG